MSSEGQEFYDKLDPHWRGAFENFCQQLGQKLLPLGYQRTGPVFSEHALSKDFGVIFYRTSLALMKIN
jgi:hypothetical protein